MERKQSNPDLRSGEASPAAEERKARRIARLEAVRRWTLILAAILMIGGYAASLKPILWGAVLPLTAALIVTYLIKYIEEGPAR